MLVGGSVVLLSSGYQDLVWLTNVPPLTGSFLSALYKSTIGIIRWSRNAYCILWQWDI